MNKVAEIVNQNIFSILLNAKYESSLFDRAHKKFLLEDGEDPAYLVSDNDFLELIAILRLAISFTSIIISTREKAEIRRIAFKMGLSQTRAGSVSSTGGYANMRQEQFDAIALETLDKKNEEKLSLLADTNSLMINVALKKHQQLYELHPNHTGIEEEINERIIRFLQLLYSLRMALTNIGL